MIKERMQYPSRFMFFWLVDQVFALLGSLSRRKIIIAYSYRLCQSKNEILLPVNRSISRAEQSSALLLYNKSMSENTRRKLTQNQQRFIVKRLSLNKKHTEIQTEFLKQFDRKVSTVTLSRLRAKHRGVITTTQHALIEAGAVQAAGLKNKAYRLLEHRLDAAEQDESELAKLRRDWQEGIIDRTEYEVRRRAYVDLSVSEITSIANMGHLHSKGDEDDSSKPTDRAALALLAEAIRSGNPVQLVQVIHPGAGQPRTF